MRKYFLVLVVLLYFTFPLLAQDRRTPNEIASERIQQAAEIDAIKLDLSNLNLTALPPEIGELTHLQVLYLFGNRLTSLPPEIGQLTNLKILSLYSNQLRELPAEIGQLDDLYYLSVAYNQLTHLPAAMGRLTNLKILNLKHNQLQELPTELGVLTNLTCRTCYLTLGSNPLESPPPEIVKEGTEAVLAYLRQRVWDDLQRLIIGSASGVGLIAALILAVRSRQNRRKPKAKRGLA